MKVNLSNFSGGMRALQDAIKPEPGTYPLLINGRTLGNVVSPIRKSVRQTIPPGRIQGIYGLDQFQVLFIDGQAWWKDTSNPLSGYTLLEGLQLDLNAYEVHFCPVPSSTLNFRRKLTSENFTALEYSITPTATSTRGALAMDGETQDWIIYPVAGGLGARITQNFVQWALSDFSDPNNPPPKDTQEYVPKGLYPIWTGQRLHKVGKDSTGAYTKILSSVSGRPIDFVVEIKSDGDKPSAPDRVAHAVAYEPIAALYTVPTQETNFAALTSTRAYGVFGDTTIKIFGEYFLRTLPLFQAGAVSHWGSVDVNGELTFIGKSAIWGMTATTQEAAIKLNDVVTRNRSFSAPIAFILTQTPYAAAIRYYDQALYAMNTLLGPSVIVYDMNQNVFVSVDQWSGVGAIKQFAITYFEGVERLWARTIDNEVFECFASPDTETARLYLGDVSSQDAFQIHSINEIAVNFTNVIENVQVTIDVYRDRVRTDHIVRTLTGEAPFLMETIVPYDEVRSKTVRGFTVSSTDKRESFATGVLVQWNGAARLTHLGIDASVADRTTPDSLIPPVQTKLAFIANTDIEGVGTLLEDCVNYEMPATAKLVELINDFAPDLVVGGGNIIYPEGSLDQYTATNAVLGKLVPKFIGSPGNVDLFTERGLVFNNYYGDGRTFKQIRVSDLVELFYLNGGYSNDSLDNLNGPPDAENAGNDINSEQAAWLREQMGNSTARMKVVIIHTPPFTDDTIYSPGFQRLRWPYRAWGANLVLSGHSGTYQRMQIDSIPYIVAGTGGATLGELNVEKLFPTAFSVSQYGFGELLVDRYSAVWQFRSITGELLDKLTIRL